MQKAKPKMRVRCVVELDVMIDANMPRVKKDVQEMVERWQGSYKPVFLSLEKVNMAGGRS
jgi:hypothetical protein